MTHELLLNELWQATLTRLGGTTAIEASAREKGAFLRSRGVVCATDLLRLVLAYCLGGMGLRLTSAWAASAGLADFYLNPAVGGFEVPVLRPASTIGCVMWEP